MNTCKNVIISKKSTIIFLFSIFFFVNIPLGAFAKEKITKFNFVESGPKTSENYFLKLRDVMDKTQTIKMKKVVLCEVGKTGTFQGLIYAGHFLNDKQLATTAANAIADIALQHEEYNGKNFRFLLNKSIPFLIKKKRNEVKAFLERLPSNEPGFISIFNGKDLSGWKGLIENPIKRAQMSKKEIFERQIKADELMHKDWQVENGLMAYMGNGYDNICTEEVYGDFEMYVDWKLDPNGKEPDAGIYLRGTPQVQIWDTSRVNVGAQVGSGGLYNNKKNRSIPIEVADNKLGAWNSFFIKMVGDKVSVLLNGVKVVDNVVFENYWDPKQPIFPIEQIELQAHGSKVYYRDIYIKRLNVKTL